MVKLYVKKIVSLNPNKYVYINYQKALKEYDGYITECLKVSDRFKPYNVKNFKDWLATEI